MLVLGSSSPPHCIPCFLLLDRFLSIFAKFFPSKTKTSAQEEHLFQEAKSLNQGVSSLWYIFL